VSPQGGHIACRRASTLSVGNYRSRRARPARSQPRIENDPYPNASRLGPPRRCSPIPTSASPRSPPVSACLPQRSIGTSRLRELRVRRAFDNGRSPQRAGAPGGFQPGGGRRQCAETEHRDGEDSGFDLGHSDLKVGHLGKGGGRRTTARREFGAPLIGATTSVQFKVNGPLSRSGRNRDQEMQI
jgi:hypothetical protein